jgi:hypothetical protein
MSLKSCHAETVNACLNLLSVIIEQQHAHVVSNLFRLDPVPVLREQRGVKQLNASLLGLVEYGATIAKYPDMDSSYQDALSDGQVRLEQHSCWRMDGNAVDQENRDWSISRECKLFEAILSLLRTFFANDTVTNLNLTQALLDLAACQHLNLHGWLLASGNRTDSADSSALNVVFVIGELVEQVRQWRSQFTEWDQLVYTRRGELDDDEPAQRPAETRNPSQLQFDTNATLRSTSPSSTQSRSRPTTPKKISTTEFGSIDSAISIPRGHRGSLVERTLAHSPLRRLVQVPPEKDDGFGQPQELWMPTPAPAILKTQVHLLDPRAPEEASESLPVHAGRKQTSSPAGEHLLALRRTDDSGTATPIGGRDEPGTRNQVSLSHILTNAVILQEFVLELAALVQLRATFFSEIDFGSTVSD